MKLLMTVLATAAILFGFGLAINEVACTPAQEAVYAQVEAKVQSDLEAGVSIPQMEQDVANIIGQAIADGGGPIAEGIVVALQDAIMVLIDFGVLSVTVLPYAKEVLASESNKLTALRAAKAVHP